MQIKSNLALNIKNTNLYLSFGGLELDLSRGFLDLISSCPKLPGLPQRKLLGGANDVSHSPNL